MANGLLEWFPHNRPATTFPKFHNLKGIPQEKLYLFVHQWLNLEPSYCNHREQFFGFNNLDYFPITLGSGTIRNLVSSSLFYSCSKLINDSGTNNLTEYAQNGNAVVYDGN